MIETISPSGSPDSLSNSIRESHPEEMSWHSSFVIFPNNPAEQREGVHLLDNDRKHLAGQAAGTVEDHDAVAGGAAHKL